MSTMHDANHLDVPTKMWIWMLRRILELLQFGK
jgi:hypothetical protein